MGLYWIKCPLNCLFCLFAGVEEEEGGEEEEEEGEEDEEEGEEDNEEVAVKKT